MNAHVWVGSYQRWLPPLAGHFYLAALQHLGAPWRRAGAADEVHGVVLLASQPPVVNRHFLQMLLHPEFGILHLQVPEYQACCQTCTVARNALAGWTRWIPNLSVSLSTVILQNEINKAKSVWNKKTWLQGIKHIFEQLSKIPSKVGKDNERSKASTTQAPALGRK